MKAVVILQCSRARNSSEIDLVPVPEHPHTFVAKCPFCSAEVPLDERDEARRIGPPDAVGEHLWSPVRIITP